MLTSPPQLFKCFKLTAYSFIIVVSHWLFEFLFHVIKIFKLGSLNIILTVASHCNTNNVFKYLLYILIVGCTLR